MALPKLTTQRANEKLTQANRSIKCIGSINGYTHKTNWHCEVCNHNWSSTPHVLNVYQYFLRSWFDMQDNHGRRKY